VLAASRTAAPCRSRPRTGLRQKLGGGSPHPPEHPSSRVPRPTGAERWGPVLVAPVSNLREVRPTSDRNCRRSSRTPFRHNAMLALSVCVAGMSHCAGAAGARWPCCGLGPGGVTAASDPRSTPARGLPVYDPAGIGIRATAARVAATDYVPGLLGEALNWVRTRGAGGPPVRGPSSWGSRPPTTTWPTSERPQAVDGEADAYGRGAWRG